MPKNNLGQAPKIRSIGKKDPIYLNIERKAWGKAIRPHELEAIIANCLDPKAIVQYKIMLFLTGNAEEKFDISLETITSRCNISKDAYYKNRTALIEKGWLSLEEAEGKSYIIIHYDKIYQDGAKFVNLKESNCKTYTDESSLINTTDESNCMNYTDESMLQTYTDEGNCMNYTDEGNCMNYTDEGNCMNYTDEGNCMNYTLKECNSQTYTDSDECNSLIYKECKRDNSQYNIRDNKNNNNNIKQDEGELESKIQNFVEEWGF